MRGHHRHSAFISKTNTQHLYKPSASGRFRVATGDIGHSGPCSENFARILLFIILAKIYAPEEL